MFKLICIQLSSKAYWERKKDVYTYSDRVLNTATGEIWIPFWVLGLLNKKILKWIQMETQGQLC